MDPITRGEMFLATAAGEYDGELPEPVTRLEYYLKKIKEAVENGSSVAPEDIDAAIESYLNSHEADIVTEQELSDALAGYYDKSAVDTALNEKQDTLTAGDNISIETVNGELTISATDTTYSDATQQTHGLMSTADKTKLDSITAAKMQAWDAAEQNVNADWTAESGDAQILHKPDLSIYALAANVTKSALGIDNVDNTSDADKPISTATETALAGKVDKETNKSLMSADEHTKLTGVEAGAQVNVQSDWEQNNSNADDFIKNKPANLVQDASYVHTDNNFTNAEKAKADGAIQSTEKGTAGGVAELDEYGHVPVSQLPSFVSDVIEGYYDSETTYKFYADAQHQTEIQGQSNKIYVDVNTNLSYRWSGSVFAEVSPSLALGSTDSTAYRGDWGTADHAAIGVLASLNTSEKSSLVAAINELQSGSVSVDPDRGLSENDFTDSLKSKLDGIESGAEVNVQSDWNQTVTTADDFIKNKPENLVQDASYVHTDNNYTTGEKTKLAGISAGAQVNTVTGVKGDAESDYRTGEINISPANIGLGNVDNTSDANKPISTATQAALDGKQNVLTFDNVPTPGSENPVKSGGIYTAIEAVATTKRYGVRWLAGNSAAAGTRLGDAVGMAAGVQIGAVVNDNDFDNAYPWSAIRRCNGDWNTATGLFEVACYEYDTYGVKNTAFKTDGSNGNVWVEIPLFWAKHIYDSEKEEKWISNAPGDGYYIPKKMQRSIARGQNKTYIAAYRASDDGNGDLVSVSGAIPEYGSFNTFMTKYKAMGTGISGTTSEDEEILDLLMDVEFATRDQQSIMLGETNRYWGSDRKAQISEDATNRIVVANAHAANFNVGDLIGVGTSADNRNVFDAREITQISQYDTDNTAIEFGGTPVNIVAQTHCVTAFPNKTGQTDTLIAPSGTVANDGLHDCRYRWCETPYGKQLDVVMDLLINNYQTYFCNDMHGGNYSNQLTDDYIPVGYENAHESGYVRNMGFDMRHPHIKNPVQVGNGASTTAGFAAHYNSETGLRVVWRGGNLLYGRNAGRSYSNCSAAPSYAGATLGTRRSYTA